MLYLLSITSFVIKSNDKICCTSNAPCKNSNVPVYTSHELIRVTGCIGDTQVTVPPLICQLAFSCSFGQCTIELCYVRSFVFAVLSFRTFSVAGFQHKDFHETKTRSVQPRVVSDVGPKSVSIILRQPSPQCLPSRDSCPAFVIPPFETM